HGPDHRGGRRMPRRAARKGDDAVGPAHGLYPSEDVRCQNTTRLCRKRTIDVISAPMQDSEMMQANTMGRLNDTEAAWITLPRPLWEAMNSPTTAPSKAKTTEIWR